ncbi:MAG TPA: hypothetical protein VJP45_06160 [Candidatus Limnocylindria bacterium]|nr:hypothetical protein [Candidatus Limnocylindria bacterium]
MVDSRGWPPESSRPTTGRHTRPPGEYPAAKPTGDLAAAPSLAEETSQVEALVAKAMKALEPRLVLKAETPAIAEMSVALTTARSTARRYKVATAFASSLLAGIGIMSGTCIATWQEAKTAAVEPAREAKAQTHSLAADVDDNRARIEKIEGTLDGIERDIGVQGRKLDRVLDELDARGRPGR